MLQYHLNLCIWIGYLFAWVAIPLGIIADMDPYYYVFENLCTTELISGILPLIFGQSIFLQFVTLFIVRELLNIFIVYESIRLCLFCVAFVLFAGQAFMTIASQLVTQVVEVGLRSKVAHIYNGLVILMQIISKPIRTTAALCLIGVTFVTVFSTFIAVKLQGEMPFYITIFNAGIVITTLVLTQLQLRTVGGCNDLSKSFIAACKSEEVLVPMGKKDRKLCRMEGKCLREMALEVGFGSLKFSRLTASSKSEVMVYIVDETINMLMAF